MIILSLILDSDAQIETPHEGSADLYDDPEFEPERLSLHQKTGKDYLDSLYDDDDYSDEDGKVKDASDGKIVVVTEETQDGNGNDYMEHYGRSDPDPPSFDGMELANDDDDTDDDHFANLKL